MTLTDELAALDAERAADSADATIPNGTRTVRALARVTRRRQILVALGRHKSPTNSPATSCAEQPVGVEADDGATSPRPVVTAT